MSIDTAADVFAHRLPVLVKQVQARIARSHELWDLPGKCVRLLQILATYTPLESPHLPLTFHRAKPAGLLDVSTRTIDRCLSTLAERGLIIRVKQKRHGPGQWDCTSIRWTSVCVEKLFAKQQSTQIMAMPVQPQQVSTTPPISLESTLLTIEANDPIAPITPITPIELPLQLESREPASLPLPEPCPGESLSHRAPNLAHKSTPSSKEEVVNKPSGDGSLKQQDQASLKQLMPRVPVDLIEPALSLALSRVQVTTLMLRCREIKQRLQDVFALTKASMDQQQLRGRDAMAWLLRVIGSGQDFRWLAKQKEQVRSQEYRLSRQQQFQLELISALSKKPLNLPNGFTLKEVIGEMAYMVDPVSQMPVSAPIRQLARKLMTQSPGWVRKLIRGQVQYDTSVIVAPEPISTAISVAIPMPDKLGARSKIADLRQLLRQS